MTKLERLRNCSFGISNKGGFLRWNLFLLKVGNNNKGLEYYISLVVQSSHPGFFERIDSTLEEIMLWVKCCQAALHRLQEFSHKKEESITVVSFIVYLKNFHNNLPP